MLHDLNKVWPYLALVNGCLPKVDGGVFSPLLLRLLGWGGVGGVQAGKHSGRTPTADLVHPPLNPRYVESSQICR